VRAGPYINDTPVGRSSRRTYRSRAALRLEQIEFRTPFGTAWVYSGVVTLTGDASPIVQFEQEDIPTQDSAFVAAQETLAVVTGTPGAISTLTAQVQITPTGVFTAAPGEEGPTLMPGQPLPTFTFPAQTSTPVIIPRVAPSSVQTIGLLPRSCRTCAGRVRLLAARFAAASPVQAVAVRRAAWRASTPARHGRDRGGDNHHRRPVAQSPVGLSPAGK